MTTETNSTMDQKDSPQKKHSNTNCSEDTKVSRCVQTVTCSYANPRTKADVNCANLRRPKGLRMILPKSRRRKMQMWE